MTINPKLQAARRWAEGIEQLCHDQGFDVEVHLSFTDDTDKWSYVWRPALPIGMTGIDNTDYFYSVEVARRIHTQFHQVLLAADGTRPDCVIPSPMLQNLIDGGDGFGRPRGDDA